MHIWCWCNYFQIRIHHLLPYVIVLVLCVTTGLLCFKFLPETVRQPTPESMEGVLEKDKRMVEEQPLNEANQEKTEEDVVWSQLT